MLVEIVIPQANFFIFYCPISIIDIISISFFRLFLIILF
jgi:hypothetical protein